MHLGLWLLDTAGLTQAQYDALVSDLSASGAMAALLAYLRAAGLTISAVSAAPGQPANSATLQPSTSGGGSQSGAQQLTPSGLDIQKGSQSVNSNYFALIVLTVVVVPIIVGIVMAVRIGIFFCPAWTWLCS